MDFDRRERFQRKRTRRENRRLKFYELRDNLVYRQAPYSSHGQPEMTNAEDNIYSQAGGSKAILRLTRRGGGKRGYRGTINLGVAT